MFAAREDALPWEPLILTVTGMDNDEIPGEWLFLMDLIESAAQIVGTALEQPYIGAAASALDSFLDWMSTPESLGKVQFGAQPPWAISDLPFEMNKINVNWQVRRLQPTPGRHLNVQLKNIHILDDGDSWPRGKGDIVVFTRVCDGLGCKVLQFGERDFDDGEVWEINQSIFRSNEQRGAGPYLYLEVGVWDDDSCLENWDMLGIVSTLLTEEDAYGMGVPIIFHDTGYDNGEVTIELEVREE